MRFSSILWFLLLGILFLPSQRTAAADGIAGSYQGRYQCGDWHKLDLQIRDLGRPGRFVFCTSTAALPTGSELDRLHDTEWQGPH
jgi:hypothetical protein